MSVQSEIVRLFNSLTEGEQSKVLLELSQKPLDETVPIEEADVICCPYCDSKLFVKNGKRSGTQNYKCKSCCKIFSSKTGTPLYRLHKPKKFELYKDLMLESYYPIKQIAEKVGISIQTAFDWRHKILSGMSKEEKMFEGVTEIDDIWFLYSQKGRKGLKYSRKRGGSKRSGDNDYQAKFLITTDRNKTTDMSLARIGRIKKSDIERKVSGKFSKDCILVSDKHRSIAAFAKSENIGHVNFKASEHTAGGGYHVQATNNMASSLKGIINYTLKGVSTKYLQNYANWYQIKSKKLTPDNLGQLLQQNKRGIHAHFNREELYRWFIENFSKRTYRSPVKRSFSTALGIEGGLNWSLT
ncbi:MAG: IS1595 family transposase [Bacteroidota bacterium]